MAVDFQESKAEVKAFVDELRLTFPTPLDAKGTVTRSFGARRLPVSFLVDRDGKILWRAIGRREWDGPASRGYFDRLFVAGAR